MSAPANLDGRSCFHEAHSRVDDDDVEEAKDHLGIHRVHQGIIGDPWIPGRLHVRVQRLQPGNHRIINRRHFFCILVFFFYFSFNLGLFSFERCDESFSRSRVESQSRRLFFLSFFKSKSKYVNWSFEFDPNLGRNVVIKTLTKRWRFGCLEDNKEAAIPGFSISEALLWIVLF